MSSDKPNSGSNSGATSETKQPPPPETPAGKLSEADFLAQQAHDAQLAMSKALHEFTTRLGQGVNPGAWAKEFPWITVGAAAVAGFVATTALVPSKEEQALKRLAAIERALMPSHPRAPKRDDANEDGEAPAPKGKQSFLSSMFHELFGVLRPAIVSMLTAGVTAHAGKPSEDEMEAAAAREHQGEQQGFEPGGRA